MCGLLLVYGIMLSQTFAISSGDDESPGLGSDMCNGGECSGQVWEGDRC